MNFDARRILVCLRYGIGDLVMELPVLEALRRAVPRAHITALGAAPATELLERHDAVNEVVALNRWGIRHRWDRGPATAPRAIACWLDQRDFDLFLDVHHVTPAFGAVVWSRGVRSLEADEGVETAAVARGEGGVEAVRAAVRAGWGLPVPETTRPRIDPPAAEREFARDYLRRQGVGSRAPLAVSPVASLSLKRWPLERMARLADEAVEGTGERVLAFCGPQQGAGEALRRQMRHGDQLVCVGPLHLLRVAALLERCRALVCNDTGLMHMAGALRVPTVAVFGPTVPAIYRPPAPEVISVGGEEVRCPHRNSASLHPPACFPAGRCLLGEQGCIQQVGEEEARAALHHLLQAPRPQRAASVA